MKKIAVLSFYSGVVDRGVETFAFELSKRLAQSYQVTLFGGGKLNADKFLYKQVKFYPSTPKASKSILAKFYLDIQSLKILVFTIKCSRQIMSAKFDVLMPLNGGWQIVIVKLISKILRKKMLVSGHAGIGSDDAWNILFRPDVFVALTSAQMNWAKKLASDVRVILIPNGVDLHRFNPRVEGAKIPLPKPIVVCASALVPYKGVDLTIRAVGKTDNLSLLLLGDGQLKGQIDGLGKRLLGKRYLRMVIPYPKIPSYYCAGDVFTLASQTEAFGIAYVEAMACNLPVVTTKDPSRKEIVGDAGVLVNTKNINRYAKALCYVARAQFKNKPYAQSLKYSWNSVAKKYSALIDQL